MERRAMLRGMGTMAMMSAFARAETPGAGGDAVFELRVYHANDGKLDDLLARFRNHTLTIFKRHGMESVAYWTPLDEGLKGRTLIYILRHPGRDAAVANWLAFGKDPEWIAVKTASEVHGPLTEKIESTFLQLTDFSPRLG